MNVGRGRETAEPKGWFDGWRFTIGVAMLVLSWYVSSETEELLQKASSMSRQQTHVQSLISKRDHEASELEELMQQHAEAKNHLSQLQAEKDLAAKELQEWQTIEKEGFKDVPKRLRCGVPVEEEPNTSLAVILPVTSADGRMPLLEKLKVMRDVSPCHLNGEYDRKKLSLVIVDPNPRGFSEFSRAIRDTFHAMPTSACFSNLLVIPSFEENPIYQSARRGYSGLLRAFFGVFSDPSVREIANTVFFMGPTLWPVREGWGQQLLTEASRAGDDFWMKSFMNHHPRAESDKVDSFLDANALYNLRDPTFTLWFLRETINTFDKTHSALSPNAATEPYDIMSSLGHAMHATTRLPEWHPTDLMRDNLHKMGWMSLVSGVEVDDDQLNSRVSTSDDERVYIAAAVKRIPEKPDGKTSSQDASPSPE